VVWIDDGVKSTAVGFVEDLNGDKLLLMPIEGHPDPETGELGITDVLLAYFDWTAWHDYRLVKDTEGMIELFVDGDSTPVFSLPYVSLNMGSLGGPVFMFGNLIDGQVARVLFELDDLNYSVGMPDTTGLKSIDGKMRLLSIFNQNPDFNPEYEPNKLVARVALTPVAGMASNTQSHKFFLRTERKIRNASGALVGATADDIQIGPLGKGENPKEIVVDATSLWDGRTATGSPLPEEVYGYETALTVFREDKKGKVKVLSTDPVSCYAKLTAGVGGYRYLKQLDVPKFYSKYESVTPNTEYAYKLTGCSAGSDPILDIFYNPVIQSGIKRYTKVETGDDAKFFKCDLVRRICYYETGAYAAAKPTAGQDLMVVVRAKAQNLGGTCLLWQKIGSGPWKYFVDKIPFSARRLNWSWDGGDVFQTVLLKNNQDTLLMLADTTTFKPATTYYAPLYVPAFDDHGGIGQGSAVKASNMATGFVYIGMKFGAETGNINIYRNDPGNDSDGDGLGDELEDGLYGLGTCKNDVGWNRSGTVYCGNALAGGKDTDGDGLKDDWEVLGKRPTDTLVIQPPSGVALKNYDLNLPALGVDPVTKNILVQVDWFRNANGNDVVSQKKDRLEKALNTIRSVFLATNNTQGYSKKKMEVIFDYGQLPFSKGGKTLEGQQTVCAQRFINQDCCDHDPATMKCRLRWSQCPAGASFGTHCTVAPWDGGEMGTCTNVFREGYSSSKLYCVWDRTGVAVNYCTNVCDLYDKYQPRTDSVTPSDPHHPYNNNEAMTGGYG
ncbi:MAG: hypothetical protein HY975_04130, partial [Candidatus Kerfeldbacteria bacterium]|nr:hypothetical protein [Candidatus Kerfeldbacteria bacterium]